MGVLAFLVKAFNVPIPMPEVAPTKTATRSKAWGEAAKAALEARTSLILTILDIIL